MPIPDPGGLLASHAGQLSADLTDLVSQLKRSTTDAVARGAAALVKAAVTLALNGKEQQQPDYHHCRPEDRLWRTPEQWSRPFRVFPEDPDDPQDMDDEDGLWRRPMMEEQRSGTGTQPMPTRWHWLEAFLTALQASVLWLRSGRTRVPLVALGTGLLGLLALLAIGPSSGVTALLAMSEILVAGSALLRAV
jgi:hypothetical protein